jgi:hypothetical protein
MLVSVNGIVQPVVGQQPHWVMFDEVSRHPDLFNPLRGGVVREVDAIVASGPVHDTRVDAARLGKNVLETVGSWWHGEFPRRFPGFPNGAARGIVGMTLWNYLAGLPNDWWSFTEVEDRHGLGQNHMLYVRLPQGDPLIPTDFSIRKFLRRRQALLIHFNTPQSDEERALGFPDDLRNAMSLREVELSFVTIQAGDFGPDPRTISPGEANADGSVGLIVDVAEVGSVVSVSPGDSAGGGFGDPPSQEACAASIDRREFSNEWRIKNYTPRGIFVFEPLLVYVYRPRRADKVVSLSTVLEAFPEERIFSSRQGTFIQYDRITRLRQPVTYDDIIPC